MEVVEGLGRKEGVSAHGLPVPGESGILLDVADKTRGEVDPVPATLRKRRNSPAPVRILENDLHRHIRILAEAVHRPRKLGMGLDKGPGNVGALASRGPVPREGQKEVALQKGRVGAQKGPVDLELGVRQHVLYGRLGGQGGPRQLGVC